MDARRISSIYFTSRHKGVRRATLAIVVLAGSVVLSLAVRFGIRGTQVQPSLATYAQTLPQASQPRPATAAFVNSAEKALPPERKLALLYKALLKNWKYQPHPQYRNYFTSAEIVLSGSELAGDCEDFVATATAVCRHLNLVHRAWLGRTDTKGHVWLEVLITSDRQINPDLERRINNEFGRSAQVVHRLDGFWLQLSPERSINIYKPTHFIDDAGNLHNAAEVLFSNSP